MTQFIYRGGVAPCLPLAGLALVAASTLLGVAVSPSASAQNADLYGTWWITRYEGAIRPNRGDFPFTEIGREAFARNVAGLSDGTVEDRARSLCLPDGVPRILASPYPFQIIPEQQGVIVIVYEVNHVFRSIQMNTPEEPLEDLFAYIYYMGHSYGKWDGSELVVRTKGFNQRTFLDRTGLPHGYRLVVTERYRTVREGQQLQVDVIVEDPDYYSEPWQTRFVYDRHPEVRIDPNFVCGEPHRDLSSVDGVP